MSEEQYEFLAMPFGLKNASSNFQRAIVRALGGLAQKYANVYINDVLIVAKTKEEAFERLQAVLENLSRAGSAFHIIKCSFLITSIEYLGYLIEAGQNLPIPRKIQQHSLYQDFLNR